MKYNYRQERNKNASTGFDNNKNEAILEKILTDRKRTLSITV